jgi:hypothetical protein
MFNFTLLEILSMVIYILLLYVPLNIRDIENSPKEALLCIWMLFSSMINGALCLKFSGGTPEPSFAINYRNLLIGFICNLMIFILFILAGGNRDLPFFVAHIVLLAVVIVPCVVYCLITKKINLLLNFTLLEMFSMAMYVFLLLLYILLFGDIEYTLRSGLSKILLYTLCTRMPFSSIINYILSLRSAGRIAGSPLAINYRNFIASFIFAVVIFVLFMLADIYSYLNNLH